MIDIKYFEKVSDDRRGETMKELTVAYLGKRAFKIKVRDHEFITDQPLSNEGENKGPTPTEYFTASIAGCVGVYAAGFLNRNKFDSSKLKVKASWIYESLPSRIGKIDIEVIPGIKLSKDNLEKLYKVVEGCMLHETIIMPPQISINIAG